MTREDAYQSVREFLWCPTARVLNHQEWNRPDQLDSWANGPFRWGAVKPPPRYKGTSGKFMWQAVQPRDFPNEDYVWDHPTFDMYMRAWESWEAAQ